MVRIWMNHWFSTAYNIINLMREGEDGFYLIGSNEREHAVYSALCDEWYQEPWLPGDAYVDFCLEFCRMHGVDLFLPRRGMVDISRRRAEFEALGVKVMADDHAIVSVLNDKVQACELLRSHGVSTVPEYRLVTDLAGFAEAVAELRERYGRVSFKFVRDEGGKSYRELDDGILSGYEALLHSRSSRRISYAEAVAALSEREHFDPLMVMPCLPGEEVSVDCLNTPGGLILLPRIKGSTRVERLSFDPELLRISREIFEVIRLECPCNIQFKYREGQPYFLEVNTRMSGGVQIACVGAGVNIPNIAVNKMLGIEKPWQLSSTADRLVSHVEVPIVLA